jgi:hypothetical protein
MRFMQWVLVLAVLTLSGVVAAQGAGGDAKEDGKSPLEKIRIDASLASKHVTDRSNHYYYYYADDFQKSIVTVRPKIRNDGKDNAKDLRVSVYLIGRMVADARMYRIIAKSEQEVTVPVKKEVTTEPLIATARYTSGKTYKRGARDCAWIVVVRDADGLMAGAACSNGQDGLLKILKTIEKCDCGASWREGVTYFNIKGEVAHIEVHDFDFDSND